MKNPNRHTCLLVLLALLALGDSLTLAAPLGTAFTYQGRLASGGNPANGSYDLRFILYTAETGGSQAGNALTNAHVNVAGGLFSTALDFGAGVFDGSARWLEIAVRTNGSGNFTTLDPRQPVPAVPNSLYALNAGNAALLNGLSPAAYAPASGSPAYVARAGDTMAGPLNLPANGLMAGGNQLVLAGGSVGIGTASPQQRFQVDYGNALVRGPGNFSFGTAATLFLGDTAHYLRADREIGLSLGTWPVGDVLCIREPAGNVGIGTATPQERLQVDSGNALIRGPGNFTAGTEARLSLGDGNNYLRAVSGEGLRLGVYQGADALVVKNGGNVGLGTAAPSQKLDVAGNISYSGQLTRLDVADTWDATVHAANLWLGHSSRRGTPGRALVDFTDRLCVNFAADWASTVVYGAVVLDPDGINAGTLSPGLIFGPGSGEGLASKRTPGGNQYGLDFYQSFQPRLSIAAGGNVGIGTTAPSERLEVTGAIVSTGTGAAPSIRLKNTSAAEWRITSYADNKLLFWNGTNRMAIDNEGKVGINNTTPAFTLDVGGNIRGAVVIATEMFRWAEDGSYLNLGLMSPYAVWTPSDASLKRDIQVVSNAVQTVQQLRGVSFHWNDAGLKHLTREIEEKWKSASGKPEDDQRLWAEKRSERYRELAKTQRGFVAQEVERVFPEWVSTDPKTGLKQIDMSCLDAVLVNAIKEQQDQLEAQQQRIRILEERLQALEQASSAGAAKLGGGQ